MGSQFSTAVLLWLLQTSCAGALLVRTTPSVATHLSPQTPTAVQVTLSQSNPSCIGYANNLEIRYKTQTLKWRFQV